MKLLKTAIRLIVRRPFVLLFPALILLVLCIADRYIQLLSIVSGLVSVTGGDALEGVVSLLQIFTDPGILPIMALAAVCFCIDGALLTGLVFSGYLNVVNTALCGKAEGKGDFAAGFKRYFFRITHISARVLFFGILTIVFIMVACVPAAVATRTAAGDKPELVMAAVFIDLLTVGVLFFLSLVFRAYLLFWYPAALNRNARFFHAARQVVGASFWKIVGRFFLFDVSFIASYFLFRGKYDSMPLFIADWLFKTFYVVFVIVYVFSRFKLHEQKTTQIE
jgi:hypothetical protein